MNNSNPFNTAIKDVTITKFNGSETLSIMPQVVEFILYQSIFSPTLKASLIINDFVNLLNNYPLVGEEIVEVALAQSSDQPYESNFYNLKFVISAIKNVSISSNNRQLVYSIDLVSEEAYENSKMFVSHAYKESIENIMSSVLTTYLKTKKQFSVLSDTKKIRDLIIPGLNPFAAITWLSKFAISNEDKKYYNYAFFETLVDNRVPSSAYTFKPLQRPSWRGQLDNQAKESAKSNPYFLVSNIETIKNNKQEYLNLVGKGYSEIRSILSLKFNKRYSTLEKIMGGYFSNEYVEVNMYKKDHKITKTTINDQLNTLHKGKLNTDQYIADVIGTSSDDQETSGKIKYIINNYDDLNQPSLRDRYGRSAMSYTAYSQIDLSVGIHTDLQLRPGDLFYADIPEFHGFNEVFSDIYLTGYFMISEIKNVIRPSGETSTIIRINKDSLTAPIIDQSSYATYSTPNLKSGGPK